MPATPDELLDRIAAALRTEIGPTVGEPFAKTQAFMAAVILDKLAGQLRAAAADGVAANEERRALVAALRDDHLHEAGPALGAAIDEVEREDRDAHWSTLVEVLYASRGELDTARFDRALEALQGGYDIGDSAEPAQLLIDRIA